LAHLRLDLKGIPQGLGGPKPGAVHFFAPQTFSEESEDLI
jgi:hypothetical protein